MASKMILRLDDAAENMLESNWNRIARILIRFHIQPIFGIIPDNRDSTLLKHEKNRLFWDEWVKEKIELGWIPAMHGVYHVHTTFFGGINPVHKRSEFAGLPLAEQRKMISHGYEILVSHGIDAKVFFAPSHTFDNNTLKALELESEIRIISDTIANNVYSENGFHFIPQQCGKVRNLPLKVVTYCYHPNTMVDSDFDYLERFLDGHASEFVSVTDLDYELRKRSIYDRLLRGIYFTYRRLKNN